jgi:hypothetical protein
MIDGSKFQTTVQVNVKLNGDLHAMREGRDEQGQEIRWKPRPQL